MITVKNYSQQTSLLDLSKLNAKDEELHKFALENLDLYELDDEIAKTIDLAVDFMNKLSDAQNSSKAQAKAVLQKEVDKYKVLPTDISGLLKKMMPKHQQQVVIGNSELKPTLAELKANLDKIPMYNEYRKKPGNKMVYAHYFYAGSDWFILARDNDYLTLYAILNNDVEMSEEGDQSYDEITNNGKVELDFFWTPKPLAEALYEVDRDYFPNPQKKDQKAEEKPKTELKAKIPAKIQKLADEIMIFENEIWEKNGWGSLSDVDKNINKAELYKKLKAKGIKLPVSKQVSDICTEENYHLLAEIISKPYEKITPQKQIKVKTGTRKTTVTREKVAKTVKALKEPFKKGDYVKIIGLKDVIPDPSKYSENPVNEKSGIVEHYQNDDVDVLVNTDFGIWKGGFLEKNVLKITKKEYDLLLKKQKAKTVKANAKPTPEKPELEQVEILPLEVTYIKSFLNLNKTKLNYTDLKKRVMKLQKDIFLKKIRKTSPFAEAINKIQDSYNAIIAKMNKGKTDINFEISDETKALLTKGLNIVETNETKIIKRFLNLYSKSKTLSTKQKAQKLLTDIQFSFDKKIISDKSEHFDEIKQIQKQLKEFVETQKMEISTFQLNGLNRIMETNYSTQAPQAHKTSYAPKKRRTLGELHLSDTPKPADQNIEKAFQELSTLVDMVIDGKQPALLISGPAGIGKTHLVRERIKQKHANYEYIKGRSTAAALFVALYENNGKTIVFDDCDSIIKSGNEDSINVLKAVLDSYDTRQVSWLAVKKPILDKYGDPIPQTFEFNGQVIFLTNIPLREIREALLSRCFTYEFNLTIDDVIAKMRSVLPSLQTTAPMFLREKALNTIIELHKSGAEIELNMRSLLKAIKILESVSDNTIAEQMIKTQCSTNL